MNRDLLAIYLTDHLAGAAAGSRRMRRLADAERNAADGDVLSQVAKQVESDRITLIEMVRAEGIEQRRYKTILARTAELVGLLKLNGRLFRRSPLSSVVEIEALLMGVTAKRCLWTTLHETDLAARHDFVSLIASADQQIEALNAAHARRVTELFSARTNAVAR